MDSSSGVGSRTRSKGCSRSLEQYDIKFLGETSLEEDDIMFLGETSGKSNEFERRNRKRKLHERRHDEEKGKAKHHPIEKISEANFWRNRRIRIEKISKAEFRDGHGDGIDSVRTSEAECWKSTRHDHADVKIVRISEAEFRSSRRHYHEEIKVEESFVEEGSSRGSSGKGDKNQHEKNELEDNDVVIIKESPSACPSARGRKRSSTGDSNNNEARPHGSGHGMNLGVASRTRSKMGSPTKPLVVDKISSDSSDGSSSSSNSKHVASLSSSDGETSSSNSKHADSLSTSDSETSSSNSKHADSLSSSDSETNDSLSSTNSKADDYLPESDDDSLSSSDSEADDADDEDFTMGHSDHSASMELSGSFIEEGDLRKGKRSGLKCPLKTANFSDNNDKEECTSDLQAHKKQKVSVKKNLAEAQVAVQHLHDNSRKRTARNIENGEGSKSMGSNKIPTQKDFKKNEVFERIHSNGHTSAGSENMKKATTRSSGITEKRMEREEKESVAQYGSSKILQKKGEKTSGANEGIQDSDTDHNLRNKHVRNKKVIHMRKDYDLCKRLLDSILYEGAEFGDDRSCEEAKQSLDLKNTLPLKFSFEDEVKRPVEKSGFEKMLDGLFDEMELCLTYGDMNLSASNGLQDNENSPDAETNQYALCSKGKHYFIEDDEIGLVCAYCFHVELEAKHVMPPWAEKTYRGADRRAYEAEQSPMLDGLNLEPGENFTGSCNLSAGTIWDIKPGIKKTMYEHQQEGLEFLWKNLAGTIDLAKLKTSDSSNIGGCIISHAPGTGKTRLTMVFIETYLKLFPNCRPLIIAPASMLLTWEEEFRKWEVKCPFHNLNNVEMSGKEDKMVLQHLQERKLLDKETARMVKIYSWIKGRSILGMSYRLFEILAGKKSKSDPQKKILLQKTGLVVLDEGHTPRSRKSNIWNTLLKLKTVKRIILSGTPFQNNFQELFNILRIVRPAIAEVLAKERIFSEMVTSKGKHLRGKDYEESKSTNHAIKELKAAMAPFVHVHKGTILQESLPGLKDCVVLLKPPPLQKSLIERIEGSQSTFNFDHKVALISVHPYLFTDCLLTEKEEKGVDQAALEATRLNPIEGIKTRFLMELVRLSAVRNEKVLVFSQYITPLMLIQEQLEKIFSWAEGKQVLKMEGTMGQMKRQNLMNDFNNPKSEAKVLLASTKCCSEGINLVGASRVVLLDVVWNPSVKRQAISRAYRLGQKKVVYTYHLMTSGAAEGDKYCRQAEKERLSELVFTSSSNEKSKHKNSDIGIEDGVLEDMVANVNLKDMFEKIIYQPKSKNLMETFSMG